MFFFCQFCSSFVNEGQVDFIRKRRNKSKDCVYFVIIVYGGNNNQYKFWFINLKIYLYDNFYFFYYWSKDFQ